MSGLGALASLGYVKRTASSELLSPSGFIYRVTALVGIGGWLFGYEIGVISGVFTMKEFEDDFQLTDEGKGLVISFFVSGNLLGALLSSMASDKFGRKLTLRASCLVFTVGGLAQALAHSVHVLYVGRLISGLAIGVTTSLVPLYNSELAPGHIRGQLVSFNQISMVGGIMVSFWVDFFLASVPHGWRIALGMQVVPALMLLAGSLLLPESPRWLVQTGRIASAQSTLNQLRNRLTGSISVQAELDGICNSVRRDPAAGAESLVSHAGLRRLFVGIMLQCFQMLTGINAVMYYAPDMFESIGFTDSYLLAQGINGVINFVATVTAFIVVDHFGRRSLLMSGAVIMGASMLILAVLGPMGTSDIRAGYICILALYAFVAGFAYSWGPVVWLLPTEIFPTSQRARGVSATTGANFFWNIIVGQFSPTLMTLLGFDFYYIFATSCFVMAAFVFFFLPETRGVPLEDIPKLFEVQVPDLEVLMNEDPKY